jgi:hypothetical protein
MLRHCSDCARIAFLCTAQRQGQRRRAFRGALLPNLNFPARVTPPLQSSYKLPRLCDKYKVFTFLRVYVPFVLTVMQVKHSLNCVIHYKGNYLQ